MAKRATWVLAVLCGLGLLSACGEDAEDGSGTGGASSGGASSGGASSGGSAGTTSGGASGGGGSAGTGAAAGSGGAGGGGGSAGSDGGAGTGGSDAGTGGADAGTGGSGGSTDSGSAKIVPTITGTQLYVNCQPIVGPDPINGSFQVSYQNTGAAAGGAKITSVKLALSKQANNLDWSFTVTPDGSGTVNAGQSSVVQHTKNAGSGSASGGSGAPCSFCGGSATLTVQWDNGTSDSTKLGNLTCAM